MMKRRAFLTDLSTLGMLSSLPLAWKAFIQPKKELTLVMASANVGKSVYLDELWAKIPYHGAIVHYDKEGVHTFTEYHNG